MVKFFCDICGVETTEGNMLSSQDPKRTRWFEYKGAMCANKAAYITVHLDGKDSGNEVCIDCVKKIINNA